MDRPVFTSEGDFGRRMADLGFWSPFVLHLCRLHRLEAGEVRAGCAGSHPVFVVEDRYAVKIYGPYGDGARSHLVEREVCALLQRSTLPVPSLVAQGELFPEGSAWPWPYLVTRALPGIAFREVEDRVDLEGRREVARFAARVLKRLHQTPLAGPVLGHSRDHFLEFLNRRARECTGDHARWQSLPLHLHRQVSGYLPPVRDLVGVQGLRLLHADLSADHLLVEEREERWIGSGVIDFGDARVGEPLYELGALHLGLFRADKRLLGTFLDAYGADPELRRDLPRRALALALLHEFDVLGPVFRQFPELGLTGTLDGVARRLFDPATPGLRGETGR